MKILETLLRARVFAGVANINGRKSQGIEDYDQFRHWKVEVKPTRLIDALLSSNYSKEIN